MKEYREKVRRLARERTGEAFFNASEDHAAIIVENMFRSAQHEVCIFTQHLAPRIYGREQAVEWAKIFLSDDKAHSLRVVVREGNLGLLENNPLFGATKNVIKLRAIDNEFHDRITQRFMVADEDCYRFEPDSTKCEAVAAFGSTEAVKLKVNFEKIWELADEVDLDNLTTMNASLAQ